MYDLAIIGAGAAGIEAAKRALTSGLRTLLIDTDGDHFGGLCLNKGCIPTKYYLNHSKTGRSLTDIYNGSRNAVHSIKSALLTYLQKNGVELVWGHAHLVSRDTLKVGGTQLAAKNILIATGSLPLGLIPVDNKKIIFAEDIFSRSQLPESILIVGAGYIGLEMACILHNLGKRVLVIEKEDRILPRLDRSLTSRLKVLLEKRGIEIKLSDDIENYAIADFDLVLLATGRKPNIEGLDLDEMGLAQENGGWITTAANLVTSASGIYACGDVTGKRLLAYVAQEQARICIENMAGGKRQEDYYGLAECVFTQPQLAYVGILEDEAKSKNIKYTLVKSNFFKFSSPYVYADTDGFIEVLLDLDGTIIGAALISQIAGELIAIFSLAIRLGLTVKELESTTFIHPTISEIISEIFKH